MDNLDNANDKRVHYKSYKDLNEFLIAKTLKNNSGNMSKHTLRLFVFYLDKC